MDQNPTYLELTPVQRRSLVATQDLARLAEREAQQLHAQAGQIEQAAAREVATALADVLEEAGYPREAEAELRRDPVSGELRLAVTTAAAPQADAGEVDPGWTVPPGGTA